jgi:hypothetical protein
MWNTVIATVVVACLCFSIGEGLRLTPFPVTPITEGETSKDDDTSLRKYGPLDVPARGQSRSKGHAVDYWYSAPERRVQPNQKFALSYIEPIDIRSLPFGSPPTGRAPPPC